MRCACTRWGRKIEFASTFAKIKSCCHIQQNQKLSRCIVTSYIGSQIWMMRGFSIQRSTRMVNPISPVNQFDITAKNTKWAGLAQEAIPLDLSLPYVASVQATGLI